MPNANPSWAPSKLRVTSVADGHAALCREVLESLPEWFGRRAALKAYVAEADGLPMLACLAQDGVVAGMLTLKAQTSAAMEIHVLGVKPGLHRRGIGRALVEAAVLDASRRGAGLLTVKTLAASHPDPHYASTRRFYEAMGFLPVEVFPTLWGEGLPCLLMARPLPDAEAQASAAQEMTFVSDTERALLQDRTRASAEQVEALLAEEFIEVGRSGRIYDRTAMLAALEAEHRNDPRINREAYDLQVRPLGRHFAHVTYRSMSSDEATNGSPRLPRTHSFRSSLWHRSDGRWRMIFHQGTALAPSSSPVQSRSRVVPDGYDTMADAYLARYGRSAIRDRKLAELIEGLARPGRVLDLGCGAGLPVARALVGSGLAVTGVDVSDGQIARARRNVPEATFVAADICDMAFPAASFDAVAAFYVMPHVPREQHVELLRRVAGWLRPGGRFLASFGSAAGDWSGDWLGVPMWFSHNAPDLAQRLVEDAGLRLEHVELLEQDNEDTSFLWLTAVRP